MSSPGTASASRLSIVLVWAALLAAAFLAWALTLHAAASVHAQSRDGPGPVVFVVAWTLMMAAMMLPSVAPVATLYLRAMSGRVTGLNAGLRVGGLVGGYLAAWAAVGIIAFAAVQAAGLLGSHAPGASRWVAVAALGAAGAYQLTPVKDRCLRHCRSPLILLLHLGGYTGPLRDLRAGLFHGGYCIGCCAGLMLVLLGVGVMNVAWMAALAAIVFLEKTWSHGQHLSVLAGLALIVFSAAGSVWPELLWSFGAGSTGRH